MHLTATKLVGRSAHVEVLEQALGELAAGRAVIVELAGEPGIGKTRLLAELAARAEGRGYLVLEGSASQLEGDLPFGVFVDALDEYVQALPPGVLGALDDDLRAQLGHVLPSQPAPPPGAPVERFRIHRAMRELLQAMPANGRLALLLDDVHWADSGSVDLLGMLLRRPPPGVLVALALRPRQLPERLAGALERALSAGMLTRIDVDRLTAEEARELLGGSLPEAVYERSGGNPFYLQQLVRFPGRGGAEAVADELRLLPRAPRRVLEGAAVAGDPFELDLAAAAADVPEPEALDALDELLASDLVRHTDVPRRFRFRHPLIRQAVYEAAPGGWRLSAHERTATALAARGAAAETLAHHVEQSARHGDAAAIAVLREAGHAVAQRTPGGAAHWFDAALRLLPAVEPAAERLELLTAAAVAAAAAGRFDEARDRLLEAETLVPPEDAVTRAGIAAGCAQVEGLMSRHEEAHRRLQRAAATLDELPPPVAVALLQQLMTNAMYRQALPEADAWAQRAYDIAGPLGDPALRASCAAALAQAAALTGRLDEARLRSDEAAALMDAMPDAEVAACVGGLNQLSSAELYLDRLDRTVGHAERALAVGRSTGQAQLFPMLASQVGWVLTITGRLADARDVLDGAAEAARLTGSAHALAWVLFTRTMSALNRGDLASALVDGAESFELTARLGVRAGIASYAGVVYGAVLTEAGEAEQALEVALARGGGAGLPFIPGSWRAFFLDRLVPAWLALGRTDDARTAAAEAEAMAAETGLASARSAALRARARIALDTGDAARAAEDALAATEAAEAIGAKVAAGISRVLAGRALAAAGDREAAASVLERAADELHECGAQRFRDEAEHELGRLGRRRSRKTRAGRPAGDGIETLTEREMEVARLIVDRRTNAEIAAELFLSPKTVESHVRNLFNKLGVSSRVEVARVVEHAGRDR